jgi:hypothetical protein
MLFRVSAAFYTTQWCVEEAKRGEENHLHRSYIVLNNEKSDEKRCTGEIITQKSKFSVLECLFCRYEKRKVLKKCSMYC